MMDNNLVLKRFFSKRMIHDLLCGKGKQLFDFAVCRYISDPEGKSYGTLISEIYAIMGRQYRTEYYYKNTMLNKLLFKNHDYKKTIALTELPIANSKADFVMINGKGIVYEIKTELDNLERLNGQIQDYYKAFTNVYLVTYQENVEKIQDKINCNVGVMVLTKRNALRILKKPIEYNKSLDYETIFRILRKQEFERIIRNHNMNLPQVCQFEYYTECFKLIRKIEINELQCDMLKQLKSRMKIETVEQSLEIPEELKFLVYFDTLKRQDLKRISTILNEQFGG